MKYTLSVETERPLDIGAFAVMAEILLNTEGTRVPVDRIAEALSWTLDAFFEFAVGHDAEEIMIERLEDYLESLHQMRLSKDGTP